MDYTMLIYGSSALLYFVVVLSVAVVAILENRQPVRTVSWVIVITCMPVFGLVLYFFFGRNIKRSSLVSRACAGQLVKHAAHGFYSTTPAEIPEDHARLIALFRRQGLAFPFVGNEVDMFTAGAPMLEQLLADIRAARHHVHVETYIVEDDSVGRRVSVALQEAARRSVSVRFVYDDVGCWNVPARFFDEMKRSGVQVKPFLPVRFPKFTSKVNYRNHRKIVVVDGRVGYVGGMNLALRYVEECKGRPAWRDMHLRIRGMGVFGLQRAFLVDWHVAAGETITERAYFPIGEETLSFPEAVGAAFTGHNVLMQTVTSFPTAPWPDIMQGLVFMLQRARHYCYLQSPYFIPTEQLLFALQTVARAGVDVKLMIPEQADRRMMTWASHSHLAPVMRAGVRVYLYRPTMLHSKVWVCDDEVCSCGSTNLDFRSFEHNFEVNAFLYDKRMAKAMRKQFLEDRKSCRLLNLERWVERSLWRRLVASVLRLLTPLL